MTQNLPQNFYKKGELKKTSVQTYAEVPSLKALLYNFDCLKNDDDLINRIVELRNCWLHGYHLFDNVKADNRTFKFDLDYLFSILKDIKRKFDDTSFQDVTYAIHECGSRIIDFYTLRNVELTFKILDSRLFKEDKIKERIDNTIKAYSHFNNPPENFYNQAHALLLNQEKQWYLIGSKFEDFMERSFVGKRLSVYEFSSKKGFDIGGYHVDADEMVLTDIDCATKYQLTINGKKLKEYKKKKTAKYALFDIYQIAI